MKDINLEVESITIKIRLKTVTFLVIFDWNPMHYFVFAAINFNMIIADGRVLLVEFFHI